MSNNKDLKELGEYLKKQGVVISDDQLAELSKQLEKDFSYVPRIGIFGKTGAGKSSLVNAVFGQDVCEVSDVESCTRNIQEQNVSGIVLIDCPGIAESEERDREYYSLYTELIPTLDAIIWVLQGDNRSYGPDLKFYELIKNCFKTKDGRSAPIFFALNQVDKIAPFREWNVDLRKPGITQKDNIDKKVSVVATLFGVPSSHVIPVSAVEKYNLTTLMCELIYSLPENQALIVSAEINKQLELMEQDYQAELAVLKEKNGSLAAEREKIHNEEIDRVRESQEKKKKDWLKTLKHIGPQVEKAGEALSKSSNKYVKFAGKVLTYAGKGLTFLNRVN